MRAIQTNNVHVMMSYKWVISFSYNIWKVSGVPGYPIQGTTRRPDYDNKLGFTNYRCSQQMHGRNEAKETFENIYQELHIPENYVTPSLTSWTLFLLLRKLLLECERVCCYFRKESKTYSKLDSGVVIWISFQILIN